MGSVLVHVAWTLESGKIQLCIRPNSLLCDHGNLITWLLHSFFSASVPYKGFSSVSWGSCEESFQHSLYNSIHTLKLHVAFVLVLASSTRVHIHLVIQKQHGRRNSYRWSPTKIHPCTQSIKYFSNLFCKLIVPICVNTVNDSVMSLYQKADIGPVTPEVTLLGMSFKPSISLHNRSPHLLESWVEINLRQVLCWFICLIST